MFKKSALLLSVALLSLSAVAVYAEPAKDDKAAKEERIALSKDLHDIRNIRDRINATIAGVAQSLPAGDQEDFAKYVALHMNYDALEQKSIAYAADIYTAPELKAMIAYFGSPDGQSAEAKGGDYAGKIGADIMKDIDAAIIAAKYDGVPDKALPKLTPSVTSGASQKLPSSTVSPDLLDSPKK